MASFILNPLTGSITTKTGSQQTYLLYFTYSSLLSEAPFQPGALPDYAPSAASAMGQLFISSYVVETAGWVLEC